MIRLYRLAGIYYVDASVSGVRKRWSLHTRDRIVAEALRRQTEMEFLGVGRFRPKIWNSFEEEFLSWIEPQVRSSTLKGYRFLVKKFGEFVRKERIVELRDVTPQSITAFVAMRRREIHPSTKRTMTEGGVRFDLRILHRVFSYAIDCQYIERNPVIAVNLNSIAGRTQPFSRDEISRILAVSGKKPHLHALILTFLHTGFRFGDVRDLRKDAITANRLLLRTRKTSRDVSLYVHPELAIAIKAHLESQNAEQKASPLMFSTAAGALIVNLDKYLRRIFTQADVAGGHAHRFRDTFAVRLLSKGASLYDVAKLMGISVQTAERHYTPYVEELRQRGAELVSKLDFVGEDQ